MQGSMVEKLSFLHCHYLELIVSFLLSLKGLNINSYSIWVLFSKEMFNTPICVIFF